MKTAGALSNLTCAVLLLQPVGLAAVTWTVDRLTDGDPVGGGEGSGFSGDLRFCLARAGSGDTVGFSVAGTVGLASSLPTLSKNIVIQGPGANVLTVHGAGGSVFRVGSGTVVMVSGLTVMGGVGNGGGVFNQGTLTLENTAIRDNTAGDPTNGDGTGAGIWNYVGATLTLNGSTVSGNSAIGNLSYAPSRGGGIANYGTLTVTNSTISGNSATQGFGGGISNSLGTSTLTLESVTLGGNSSPGTSGSGGLDNHGTLTAGDSIVAGNSDGDLAGDLISEGYNLFGTTNGNGFDPTDLLGVDPLLGPLQDNGGSTSTMSPLPGSPAVDRIPGTPGVDFPATDQRGIARPQASLADSGAVEIGGFQVMDIAPSSGAASGGTPVAIAGTGFLPGASLMIGGIPAENVVVVASTEIDATTPALPAGALADVVVTNPASPARPLLSSAALVQGWLADFWDVPQSDGFHDYVETIFRDGITAGCGAGLYCRDNSVVREQMAVFLLKAEHGSAYLPPGCVGTFGDVPCPSPFADWIEQLSAEGITGGCGGNNYCPASPVTRAQMSVFLQKTKYGSSYAPPSCTGVFGDVVCPSLFADWIEELYAEGVTGGCSTSPLLFCPARAVTRGQMATFLVKAFSLQ